MKMSFRNRFDLAMMPFIQCYQTFSLNIFPFLSNVYANANCIQLSDLAPEGNLQQAQADSLAHVVNELETTLTEAYGEKDPERKV